MDRIILLCFSFLVSLQSALSFDQTSSLMLQEQMEPESFHPLHIEGYDSTQMQMYVLEPLLRRDENTYEWMPALASRWQIDEKNKVFTFWLREDATWSDGKPFTAHDVKFSFDVLFSGRYRTFHLTPSYENISKVEVVSPHQVRFHAKNDYFLNFSTVAGMMVLPKHIYGPKKPPIDTNRQIIGTGPYQVAEWAHGKYIHLSKNPKWWGESVAQYENLYRPQNVVFRFIEKNFTALEMLKKGALDYMILDYNLYQKLGTQRSGGYILHRVENSSPKSVPYLGFNLTHPFLKDIEVRKALSLLIDRKSIVEKLFSGEFKPAAGPWYNESPFTPPEYRESVDEYSPEKALKILTDNGWADKDKDGVLEKNGKKLEFTILFGEDEPLRVLSMFKFDASKVGVKINLKRLEWNVINQRLKVAAYDALYTDWGPGPLEFDPRTSWHSSAGYDKGGLNFMKYKNPKVDSLIDTMLVTADIEQRSKLYHEAYREIKKDQPALFFFYQRYQYYAASSRVGQMASTLQYDVGTKSWWLKNNLGASR